MKQNINNLKINEDLKLKLSKLLINTSSSFDSSKSDLPSDEINKLDSSSEEDKSEESCFCKHVLQQKKSFKSH